MDDRRVLRFKDFILEEGELWDAVCFGVNKGLKAFKHKRQEQAKKSETTKLTQQILSAEGADIRRLVKKIVDNGYSVKDGKVTDLPKRKLVSMEVLECTRIKMASA